jgi:hypothetical protein
LAFEKGVLAFENGVLAFEKEVLAFENVVLAFENGNFLKFSTCIRPSDQGLQLASGTCSYVAPLPRIPTSDKHDQFHH